MDGARFLLQGFVQRIRLMGDWRLARRCRHRRHRRCGQRGGRHRRCAQLDESPIGFFAHVHGRPVELCRRQQAVVVDMRQRVQLALQQLAHLARRVGVGEVLAIDGYRRGAALGDRVGEPVERQVTDEEAQQAQHEHQPERRDVWHPAAGEVFQREETGLRQQRRQRLHDAAVDRRGVVVAADIGAADHVEDDVDALAAGGVLGNRHEILLAVVDRAVGAEPEARLALFLRTGSGDDGGGAEGGGELDRGRADARGAAVDQEGFARFQAAPLEHVVPDGEVVLRQRRRLDQRQSVRHWQALRQRRHGVFRIAATGEQGAHGIARLEAE